MALGPSDHIHVLSATAWDLRATVEATLRSLTSLQRCIDEYRIKAEPAALGEIADHLAAIETRLSAGTAVLPYARQSLRALQANHSPGEPASS